MSRWLMVIMVIIQTVYPTGKIVYPSGYSFRLCYTTTIGFLSETLNPFCQGRQTMAYPVL